MYNQGYLNKYWVIVLWINTGIVAIPLFKVDVPSSSECIRFGAKFSRMETNNEVETGEVFVKISQVIYLYNLNIYSNF